MATPAVTGFAAVLKAAHPDLSGTDLADYIKASVRPMASLKDRLQSGGMIDFQVAESGGTAQEKLSPVIHKVEVSGKSVTIEGVNFGEKGSVAISRFIAVDNEQLLLVGSEYSEETVDEEIAVYESDYSWLPKRSGVLLPVSGGFLLLGPAAANGSGDSFLLRDEETVFTPYAKRMSDSKVFFPAAASVDGKVYVIGSTLFEANQRFFRATTLNASENADQEAPANTNLVLYIVLGIVLILAIVAVIIILLRRRRK